ncbi:branched-chain amino acid ABC transporter permease [Gulosibacter molinativorax]|uniref:Branched-chain amino acid ABC transporter permease n=1 Tax=Gulosibacter molinativorax TaxID=256821 RepID=A0ABT7C796_9MICO|nr:branched-chain amino acid ABC transporter permease [Gulosibacter molinativorax]MDJ1370634.1 branched-chain amino acid ABC transporter permease [Gulosibacter molinativorax]QUY61952.1 Branched-chain amino acid transport system permease protein LivM [Gulosibacter molinativorax]
MPDILRKKRTRSDYLKAGALIVGAIILLILPLYISAYWLQLGFLVSSLAIGAIGLNILTGTAGQLSMAHPFFMGLGALSYVVLAGESGETSLGPIIGLGWPPLLAMIGAVIIAGIAGLAFSPLSARLSGIYLAVASLALVFIGVHVLNTASALSGGFNGRAAPTFELFGIVFGASENPIVVAGVPFGKAELQWYLGLVVLAIGIWFAKNLLNSRTGRALKLINGSPLTASVVGVEVMDHKGKVFFLSSIYAGMGGVLYALAIGSIAPQSFDMSLSLEFFAMIVIGGLGSVGGAVVGAAFVVALPQVLQANSSSLEFVTQFGITTAHLSNYIYGAAIILVLIFKPTGLAGLWHDLGRWLKRRFRPDDDDSPDLTTKSVVAVAK